MFHDQISLDRVATLHPALREEAASILANLWSDDIPVRVTYGLRTWAEQDALYAQGRTKPGAKVTNAKGGSSYHNYGLALDFCLLDKKKALWSERIDLNHNSIADWVEVVRAFKAAGWEWGGDWKSLRDAPHVQKTFGFSITQLKTKSKNGQIQYVEL